MLKIILEKISDRLIKKHPNAASSPRSMKPFSQWIIEYSKINTKLVMEIGANYGQDAEGLRHYFGLQEKNVWVIEAHPDIYSELVKYYPKMNAYNIAAYNKNKIIEFNIIDAQSSSNSGISSVLNNSNHLDLTKKIEVQAIRMESFIVQHKIQEIDFLKLDVEGVNYEVLEGFGASLQIVKAIHIEAEHVELWQGQKLFEDIKRILIDNGFELIYFQRRKDQSDSMWIRSEYMLRETEDNIAIK